MNESSGNGMWASLDRLAGLRIGGLVGGVLGGGVSVLTGLPVWACLPAAAIVGGIVGFVVGGRPPAGSEPGGEDRS